MTNVLTWRITRQPKPYGPLHIGFLGSIPVASIEDKGEPFISKGFDLHFSLPPKSWRKWEDWSTLTGHVTSFAKLVTAKKTAEYVVQKWLSDAKLKTGRR